MPDKIPAWRNCQVLGGEEGVQVDAELAAEATDGADVKVNFLKSFSRPFKFLSKSFTPSWDSLSPQGLLDLRFQGPSFPAGHLNLVQKLPAFACVLLEPVCPSIHDSALDLTWTADQVNKAWFRLVVTIFCAIRAAACIFF